MTNRRQSRSCDKPRDDERIFYRRKIEDLDTNLDIDPDTLHSVKLAVRVSELLEQVLNSVGLCSASDIITKLLGGS